MKIYRWLNILSIDVAGGAAACALFFARLFGVTIFPQGVLSLGLAVWIIYTSDHLLDAWRLKEEASTMRHRFHQRHFRVLIVLVCAASFIELVMIFFLRKPLFYSGLYLSVGVIFYILINRWLKYFKEVTAASLYTSGVLLPVFSLRSDPFSLPERLMIVQFVLIVFINLVLFSWMDYERDRKDQHHSLITYIGKRGGAAILMILFIVVTLIHSITISIYHTETMIFIIMSAVLLLLFLFHNYFGEKERFRFWGDAIFFFPAVILLIR